MAEAAKLNEEEGISIPHQQAVVIDMKTHVHHGSKPLHALVSDHYGNKYCPDTGVMLFCHRISTGGNHLLYDTF